MTVGWSELALYVGALAVLFITPGPVWLALLARGMAGGFRAAWPLALGVAVGDALWPLVALLGLGWFASSTEGILTALRFVAMAVFLWMGWGLLRREALTPTPGGLAAGASRRAGFIAGLAAILGNPKAILFYLGVLPGFFDLTRLGPWDVAMITAASMAVPLCGNLALSLGMGRVRAFLASPRAQRRANRVAGILLIAVGLALPFA